MVISPKLQSDSYTAAFYFFSFFFREPLHSADIHSERISAKIFPEHN